MFVGAYIISVSFSGTPYRIERSPPGREEGIRGVDPEVDVGWVDPEVDVGWVDPEADVEWVDPEGEYVGFGNSIQAR